MADYQGFMTEAVYTIGAFSIFECSLIKVDSK